MSTSLAAAALTGSASASGQTPSTRQYYELRRYSLISGPQMAKLTDAYVADALIPALNRLGITPVGAFNLSYGPETPALYLLLPARSYETLLLAPSILAADEAYQRAAAPFLNAPTGQSAFHRVDSTLLHAFEGFPILKLPAAGQGKRIFQLRTYESPTPATFARKLEMFHHGEFDIFKATGLESVFFGETVIGARMPSLTYMLTFPDLATLEANWKRFGADPAWKKLSTDPRYASDTLVSNITNLVLTPASYSQL